MENEETIQTAKAETASAASPAKKSAKKKQGAQSGETALQKVGKAAIARHGFSAVYVTSDGLAFAQECDAKSHASDLSNKDILKVTKQ